MYRATHVESMVLQVRMITELVALASLAANKSIFEQNRTKFEDYWRPKEILKDVESLNPNFYPRPIVEVPLKNSRAKNELVEMNTGFMKRDELIQVHRECGKRLHAQNPFGKAVDYDYYEKNDTEMDGADQKAAQLSPDKTVEWKSLLSSSHEGRKR